MKQIDAGGKVAAFSTYELSVGGGVLALSPMPLALPHGWDVVVSMSQAEEMPQDVTDAFQLADIEWIQFPVDDYGVPAGGDWDAVEARVLSRLARRARVLIHCKGGCGRSGMAVLRIMIAAGEDPTEAFARLRAVRPCAVETEAQLAWASGASLPWSF